MVRKESSVLVSNFERINLEIVLDSLGATLATVGNRRPNSLAILVIGLSDPSNRVDVVPIPIYIEYPSYRDVVIAVIVRGNGDT